MRLRGYAHAYAQTCAKRAKPKDLANGDPRLGLLPGEGSLLSSQRTDGETGQQLSYSFWPLLVVLSHYAIYITVPPDG